jgi:hypothetical protein
MRAVLLTRSCQQTRKALIAALGRLILSKGGLSSKIHSPAVTEELVGIRRRRIEATQVLFRAIKPPIPVLTKKLRPNIEMALCGEAALPKSLATRDRYGSSN